MNEVNKIIPLTTEEGNEYLIQFTEFSSSYFSTTIPIVDISLVLTNENHRINSTKTLFQISDIIRDYLASNDVILYYYCDSKEIIRSQKHMALLPQEYRSMLFLTLFEKKGCEGILYKSIIVDDPINGSHYIALLCNQKFCSEIELIHKEIETQSK